MNDMWRNVETHHAPENNEYSYCHHFPAHQAFNELFIYGVSNVRSRTGMSIFNVESVELIIVACVEGVNITRCALFI